MSTARALIDRTRHDGRERAVVIDFDTGAKISEAVGDGTGVKPRIPEGKNVATLHTHPNGDNIPSPSDIIMGFVTGSKAEYVAAGKKVRRWVWLKVPTPEDADLLKMYEADNSSGGVNLYAYYDFLRRLQKDGYIKMEVLS